MGGKRSELEVKDGNTCLERVYNVHQPLTACWLAVVDSLTPSHVYVSVALSLSLSLSLPPLSPSPSSFSTNNSCLFLLWIYLHLLPTVICLCLYYDVIPTKHYISNNYLVTKFVFVSTRLCMYLIEVSIIYWWWSINMAEQVCISCGVFLWCVIFFTWKENARCSSKQFRKTHRII